MLCDIMTLSRKYLHYLQSDHARKCSSSTVRMGLSFCPLATQHAAIALLAQYLHQRDPAFTRYGDMQELLRNPAVPQAALLLVASCCKAQHGQHTQWQRVHRQQTSPAGGSSGSRAAASSGSSRGKSGNSTTTSRSSNGKGPNGSNRGNATQSGTSSGSGSGSSRGASSNSRSAISSNSGIGSSRAASRSSSSSTSRGGAGARVDSSLGSITCSFLQLLALPAHAELAAGADEAAVDLYANMQHTLPQGVISLDGHGGGATMSARSGHLAGAMCVLRYARDAGRMQSPFGITISPWQPDGATGIGYSTYLDLLLEALVLAGSAGEKTGSAGEKTGCVLLNVHPCVEALLGAVTDASIAERKVFVARRGELLLQVSNLVLDAIASAMSDSEGWSYECALECRDALALLLTSCIDLGTCEAGG